jgi:hypothetical protein
MRSIKSAADCGAVLAYPAVTENLEFTPVRVNTPVEELKFAAPLPETSVVV